MDLRPSTGTGIENVFGGSIQQAASSYVDANSSTVALPKPKNANDIEGLSNNNDYSI